MSGPVLAFVSGQSANVRQALGLLGFAGVGVWLGPLWGADCHSDHHPSPLKNHKLRIAYLLVAAVAAVILGWFTPREAIISLGVVSVVLFIVGLTFPGRRVVVLLIAGVLAVVVVAFGLLGQFSQFGGLEAGLLGRGERALADVWASDAGLVVLLGMVGWAGTIWFAGGIALSLVYILLRARRGGDGDRGRAIVWTVAAALSSCAMLVQGGFFIPSVTLAAAFTWGLLPSILDRPGPKRSGLWVLIVLSVLFLLLGLTRGSGLANRIVLTFKREDVFLHMTAGFLLGLVLSWLMSEANRPGFSTQASCYRRNGLSASCGGLASGDSHHREVKHRRYSGTATPQPTA